MTRVRYQAADEKGCSCSASRFGNRRFFIHGQTIRQLQRRNTVLLSYSCLLDKSCLDADELDGCKSGYFIDLEGWKSTLRKRRGWFAMSLMAYCGN